jgi:hypothetical protein
MKDFLEILFKASFQLVSELLKRRIDTSLSSSGKIRALRDQDGWIKLRGTNLTYCLGLLCIPVAVCGMMLSFIFATIADQLQFMIPLTFSATFSLAAWFGVYSFLVVQTRFNNQGIEYRGLLRLLFIPWNDVEQIATNAMIGSFISTRRGILIVSKFTRGFAQLVSQAK